MTLIHIAGSVIQVGQHMRQRCPWCGALLCDYDLNRIASPVGQEGLPPTFEPGNLVAVDGGAMWTIPYAEGDSIPRDACAVLPPEVTANPMGMEVLLWKS